MSDSSRSSDDENGAGRSVSRRTILNGAVGTGALALGVGGVAANGKGGQAFVLAADFKDGEDVTFTITDGPSDEFEDVDEDQRRKTFDCGRNGPGLPFPYWRIKYDDENYDEVPDKELPKLYTRDNRIKTGISYRWTNVKPCGDNKQVGFAKD